ncbi:hypothetical protein VTN00DRAFT_46 [Thermoascus crustaceus]|uniref:uncharacterized protein n=1 Tax=Thermoascus crustaceus TaxID=5088 RepID=UPI003743549C
MAFSIVDSSDSPTRPFSLLPDLGRKQSMWQRLGLGRWLGRNDKSSRSPAGEPRKPHDKDKLTRRLSRKVGVGFPRKKQNSERRDHQAPVDPSPRRPDSADHRQPPSAQKTRSPPPTPAEPKVSEPEEQCRDDDAAENDLGGNNQKEDGHEDGSVPVEPVQEVTDPRQEEDDLLEMELDRKWILNLSMHFRDKSEREKFFVTYAEAPNRWRRVTISCDYRGAPPDSLEQDLKELHYQRDKSARIYESIRESLPEIQFYDTVTNLKLETSGGRLHVHVTEDVNEIIPYPPICSVRHLNAPLIPEDQLNFDSHLSGFVYKVLLDGKAFIKKEIPGPDTVDEFLYEINALHALRGSRSVIQLEGIVVDDRMEVVKGLLISFAEQGALVDILYDHRGEIEWARRERWARQIVQGLHEIHDAGYVQGDFTLSNIVIDENDDAKIIDINRRGCPVGWEPPEIAVKIESNQRISMYIGVKSDIFQLGMTLWALAMQEDEPERQSRPLVLDADAKVPDYYRKLVATCLSPLPQDRLSAKELLAFFPQNQPRSGAPNGPRPGRRSPPQTQSFAMGVNASLETATLAQQNGGIHGHPVMYMTASDFATPAREGARYSQYPPHGLQPSPHEHAISEYHSPGASPYSDSHRSFLQSDFEPGFVSIEPYQEFGSEEVQIAASPSLLPRDTFTPEGSQDSGSRAPEQHRTGCVQDRQGLHPNGGAVPRVTTAENGRENEIDLDATVDPRYRYSKPSHLVINSLPGDLAGVGGHPACSLERDAADSTPSSQDLFRSGYSPLYPSAYPVESYGTRTSEDLGEHRQGEQAMETDWPTTQPTRRNSSLLDSRLPINPACDWSKRRSTCQLPFLLDSQLPINPAFPGIHDS